MAVFSESPLAIDRNGTEPSATSETYSTGILPSQTLRECIRDRIIGSLLDPLGEDQIQPASIDLRLSGRAFRVRASFLPGERYTVKEKIDVFGMHEIDLREGAVLERGCVYIVPLQEALRLPRRLYGVANPKSSTGRLDVFTRLITDHGTEFDRVEEGYKGPLYAEISPRTFSVVVRQGSRLLQLRLRRGTPRPTDAMARRLQEEVGLIGTPEIAEGELAKRIHGGVPVSVDLKGQGDRALVGYKAKAHAGLVDVDRVGGYAIDDYWDPIHANAGRTLILDPNAFYILASKEAVTVPPDYAAEMAPFNPLHGEFRVHYAGFFDPGFGFTAAGGEGSRAVLEVRSYEVPFLLEDGQIVGKLLYERLTATPDRIYGQNLGSNYQRQGLKLSKHFRL
ncbi:MAG: 2'-deoxycytidine 5'-triphosphate deaminase [Alphaproteobacteria bacterium]|nr:2'-deoxycytidine 5'-triphosphate deaminase [Alphaproteobacteria bacterium]